MAWRGVVWYGVVWCGVVWREAVWQHLPVQFPAHAWLYFYSCESKSKPQTVSRRCVSCLQGNRAGTSRLCLILVIHATVPMRCIMDQELMAVRM